MPIIRPETQLDCQEISELLTAAFPTAVEAKLVVALRRANRLTVSLVAVANDSIIGHVAFSPVSATSGAAGIGLAPVAVAEAHRRQGVAASLIRAGLEACRDAGLGWAVVLGDPHYYGRFGFRPAADFGLADEYGGGAAFQALELLPNALPQRAGLVRYSEEFAVFA